jgi:membrane-bound lytic murein transglycosylase D
MLELLIAADLDPTVYYNLRKEFERVLLPTAELAKQTQSEAYRFDPAAIEFTAKSNLEFPNPLNQYVLDEINEIQRGYPRGFQTGLDRSASYLPYIRAEMRKAGLPEDLAWLAQVESAFQPKVNSRVGAGGMWQFMKGTARRYGLRVDYYVDERYDWKKSTKAAIAYLSELHAMFDGNWPLAISAYNKGEYGLERAIVAGGNERDLWRLIEAPGAVRHLPRETKKFYPKLLASVIVARDPERYGFTKPRLKPEQSEYTRVAASYALSDIEAATGLPKDSLKLLNPHLLRGITPPGGQSDILVPSHARMQIAAALNDLPTYRAATHVVQRGETLSRIASRYEVSVNELMQTNSIRSAKRLQIGQRLAIPHRVAPSQPNVVTAAATSTYTVQKGDTLTTIADEAGLEIDALLAANQLDLATPLYVGDTLNVANASAPDSEIVHVVQSGEYPARIAARYDVSVDKLLAWNGLTKKSTIHIGDTLKVYGKGTLQAATESQKTIHKVSGGETVSVIAAHYGVRTSDVLRWNSLRENSLIRVGQDLVIYAPPREVQVAKASGNQRLEHVVAAGQSAWIIARNYGVKLLDLFSWNGWDGDPVLQVGEKVVVYTD